MSFKREKALHICHSVINLVRPLKHLFTAVSSLLKERKAALLAHKPFNVGHYYSVMHTRFNEASRMKVGCCLLNRLRVIYPISVLQAFERVKSTLTGFI